MQNHFSIRRFVKLGTNGHSGGEVERLGIAVDRFKYFFSCRGSAFDDLGQLTCHYAHGQTAFLSVHGVENLMRCKNIIKSVFDGFNGRAVYYYADIQIIGNRIGV